MISSASTLAVLLSLSARAPEAPSSTPSRASGPLEESIPDPNDPTQKIEGDSLEIEIVIDTPQPEDGAEQVIETQEALSRAGTQGDVVAAVRTLPGVARSSPGSGELSLWGAMPAQSRLYVEDIPVPRLFHWGLARSVLPASQIKSLRIEPVAFSADYGRAIGGMANVSLNSPLRYRDHRVHTQLDLSLLEAAAAVSQRTTPRWGWSAALRHSLQAQVMRGVLPTSRKNLYPLADNFDYQLSAQQRVMAQTHIGLRIFGAHSKQEIARASRERSRRFSQTRRNHFHRLAFTFDQERQNIQRKGLLWFGLTSHQDNMQWQDNTLVAGSKAQSAQGGLRLASTHWFTDRLRARVGADLEWSIGNYEQRGSATLPAREGDPRVWGQPPGPEFTEDTWKISRFFAAPFLNLSAFLGENWSLSGGLRLETSASSGNKQWPARPTEPSIGILTRDLGASPRMHLKWTRSRFDHWSLRAGIHRQLAAPQDLSPRFGTPTLGAQRAYQVAFAANLFPLPGLTSDWTFFWNQQSDLITRSRRPSPALAENLLNQGSGRNWGAQTQLRYDPSPRLSLIAHYSLTLARKKDLPELEYRPTDLAQTHQAQALVSGQVGQRWTLSGRFQWSSGFPRTAVFGALPVDEGGIHAPLFGPTNQSALPDFWSASVRAAYQRVWGQDRQRMVRVWLDIQNVTNHRNVEEFTYSYNYGLRYTMPGLPIFPSLGLTITQ